ncbi:hypothetical protein PGQ11_015639 [Apiospora arundinis]|uniref:Uncharacterized protein n=1 Tax=Apiospora arundinis TaxID=335852 RepID=A0ABR2HMS1_9PEZI
MPVIPINFPGFTHNITFSLDPDPSPISSMGGAAQSTGAASTVDTVVDGLAAIGITKGWVTFFQTVLVLVFVSFALFAIIGLVAGLTGGLEASEQRQVQRTYRVMMKVKGMMESQSSNKDVEKDVAGNEVESQRNDRDSLKTCVEA